MARRKGAKRDGAKERRWRGVMARFRRRGETVRRFCTREGLAEPSFYHWRAELTRRDRQRATTAAAMAEGRRPGTKDGQAPLPAFVPVRIVAQRQPMRIAAQRQTVPDDSPIEVVLGAGRLLRVRPGL